MHTHSMLMNILIHHKVARRKNNKQETKTKQTNTMPIQCECECNNDILQPRKLNARKWHMNFVRLHSSSTLGCMKLNCSWQQFLTLSNFILFAVLFSPNLFVFCAAIQLWIKFVQNASFRANVEELWQSSDRAQKQLTGHQWTGRSGKSREAGRTGPDRQRSEAKSRDATEIAVARRRDGVTTHDERLIARVGGGRAGAQPMAGGEGAVAHSHAVNSTQHRHRWHSEVLALDDSDTRNCDPTNDHLRPNRISSPACYGCWSGDAAPAPQQRRDNGTTSVHRRPYGVHSRE